MRAMTTVTLVLLCASLAGVVGCAHNEKPAKSPSQACSSVEIARSTNPTLAKIQGSLVDGTTWVWNETTMAWEWVTSDGVKVRVREGIDAAKKTIKSMVDN